MLGWKGAVGRSELSGRSRVDSQWAVERPSWAEGLCTKVSAWESVVGEGCKVGRGGSIGLEQGRDWKEGAGDLGPNLGLTIGSSRKGTQSPHSGSCGCCYCCYYLDRSLVTGWCLTRELPSPQSRTCHVPLPFASASAV